VDNGKGCREWTGAIGSHRYGAIRVGHTVKTTARVTFEAFHRDLEPGELARHTCDNRLCVNADHLIPGTHIDNMDDWKRRRDHAQKLDPSAVVMIRNCYAYGVSSSIIANAFEVSVRTVQRIMKREIWTHV
jgi:hypothetical protein